VNELTASKGTDQTEARQALVDSDMCLRSTSVTLIVHV
jgi:hypothetical protein